MIHENTEGFSFTERDGAIEIAFGESKVALSRSAARDLLVRLSSYLVFLEQGALDENAPNIEKDNIVFLRTAKRGLDV